MIFIQNIENKTFRKAIGIEFARLCRERNQELEKVAAAVSAYPETVDRLELGIIPLTGLPPGCSNIITKTSKSNSSTGSQTAKP